MERFAGYTPGMMFVLGADLEPRDIGEQIEEAKRKDNIDRFVDWFSQYRGVSSHEQVEEWLDSEGITLKKLLGEGGYGQAWQVDSEEFGKNIVLKITSHTKSIGLITGNEADCVEWIYKNQDRQTGGKFKHLPQIFDFGTFSEFFWYLRPMYDLKNYSPAEVERLKVQVMADSGDEFYPYDLRNSNLGDDPETGEVVYFDPACALNPAAPFTVGHYEKLERLIEEGKLDEIDLPEEYLKDNYPELFEKLRGEKTK